MKTNYGPIASTRYGKSTPVALDAVRLTSGVLSDWALRNRDTTLPHGVRMLVDYGVLDNFKRLIGESESRFQGLRFVDSDLYKTLEAIAWELGREPNRELREFYDSAVRLVEQAQAPDGYVNTAFQRSDREQEPWSDFPRGHELYCLGHLIQAAVAEHRAIGESRLVVVASRFVDLVIEKFGSAESDVYGGHPEIEMALVELYRLSGDEWHLRLAEAFVNRRGRGVLGEGDLGSQYYQDDVPVRDSKVMRGHVVRALYLNAGVADLYLETGEDSLLVALREQWDDLVDRRLYLTGGAGSRHRDEAFGDAYELPSERAYAETCAGIALLQWSWRMYLATGHARYLDTFELTLYNAVAAGISEEGDKFFYSNPLQRRADHGSTQEEGSARRQSWFLCACCPPNIMRTLASIENYLVSQSADSDELRVGIYAHAEVTTTLRSGARIELEVTTDYPVTGAIRIHVKAGAGGLGVLALRIPSWCKRYGVRVDGSTRAVSSSDGWLRLDGVLLTGTVVDLDLELEPIYMAGHPRADGVRGSIALQRGPVVYCVDQADNAIDVDSLALEPSVRLEQGQLATALGPLIRCEARLDPRKPDAIGLYRPYDQQAVPVREQGQVVFRPYATWGNADVSAMRVWIPAADGN